MFGSVGSLLSPVKPSHTPKASSGEPGDHERLAHYVEKQEWVAGYLGGSEITSLCGKTWVPTRDPQGFPVCPECKEAYEGFGQD